MSVKLKERHCTVHSKSTLFLSTGWHIDKFLFDIYDTGMEVFLGSKILCALIKGEQAKRASLWYRGGVWGDGSDPVLTFATPPRGIKQSGPNFQGVIRSWERLSSNIWFFKKLKYKKLLVVKLPWNTACSPFELAEFDSLEVDWLLRVIRTHGLLSSLRNCFKKLKYKLEGDVLMITSGNNASKNECPIVGADESQRVIQVVGEFSPADNSRWAYFLLR